MKEERTIPKVGVALLAYNQGNYVDAAIESLKRQKFQDFEVYLIDDGSDDGYTSAKLAGIEYDKITKKFLHKKNIGSPGRRKQYDLLMQNEYIINFCGDDILDPMFFHETVNFLDKNKKYGAVSTNIRLFNKNPEEFYYEKKYDANKMNAPMMLVNCNVLGSSLMRKEALEKIDLRWPLKRCYDWNRWIAMLESGWKIGLIEAPLFYYRQINESLSHSINKEDMFLFYMELMKRYHGLYDKYSDDIIKDLYRQLVEVQEGKDWLDSQYGYLNREIERLKSENEILQLAEGSVLYAIRKKLGKIKRKLVRDGR